MAAESNIQYYFDNHPSVLQESDEYTPSEILKMELELSQAWDKFTSTFAFADLSLLLDGMKNTAYQTMVTSEEIERQHSPGYRSDAWLKGRLSVLAELKHHISDKLDALEGLTQQIKEAQEQETAENQE